MVRSNFDCERCMLLHLITSGGLLAAHAHTRRRSAGQEFSPPFVEAESSLPYSQQPLNGTSPKPFPVQIILHLQQSGPN
jgi:hypothetical protein